MQLLPTAELNSNPEPRGTSVTNHRFRGNGVPLGKAAKRDSESDKIQVVSGFLTVAWRGFLRVLHAATPGSFGLGCFWGAPGKRVFALVLLLVGPIGSSVAVASEARAALERFLSGLDSYSAQFRQTLVDETGFIVQEGQGRLDLALPDRLRWEVDAPFAQVIVADGDSLWLYDPDLRQVTVRPLESALEATPLALLTQPQRLDERFMVGELPIPAGYRLLLHPRSAQSDFSQIVVDLNAASALQALHFDDVFGQRTTLEIFAAQRNPALSVTYFQFVPPPGTDVFRP